jgi:hypothetical protein
MINFTNMRAGDISTYPKETGQYLIKYHYNDNSYFMIAYFWVDGDDWLKPKNEKRVGFYYDENCEKEANIETQWGYKPYAYYKLPNILSEKPELDV